MSLYPSLEDMKVDRMMKMQNSQDSGASLPYPVQPRMPNSKLYPSLTDYMGLELSPAVIEANNLNSNELQLYGERSVASVSGLLAPISGNSRGLHRAFVTNGIREAVLCKDGEGKLGLRLTSVNNGLFVALVQKDTPAAYAGIRFGDQVLQVMDEDVTGLSADVVHSKIRKAPSTGISFVLRDRPFERTVTLHKDSYGTVGFTFKDGKITNIVKGSSAARNGLLIDHQILEINGQNVIGMKDKEITKIVTEAESVVTVTVIPVFIYEHMTKNLKTSLFNTMDHSVW